MSIDAKIVGTTRKANGEVTISLERRNAQACAGQQVMTILNPPDLDCDLSRLIDLEIWGGSNAVYVRDDRFADRVGYTQLRLVDGWVAIASRFLVDRLWKEELGK